MKESVNKTFNQFKIHTQYSICEGAVKIDQLKDFCKKNRIKSYARRQLCYATFKKSKTI